MIFSSVSFLWREVGNNHLSGSVICQLTVSNVIYQTSRLCFFALPYIMSEITTIEHWVPLLCKISHIIYCLLYRRSPDDSHTYIMLRCAHRSHGLFSVFVSLLFSQLSVPTTVGSRSAVSRLTELTVPPIIRSERFSFRRFRRSTRLHLRSGFRSPDCGGLNLELWCLEVSGDFSVQPKKSPNKYRIFVPPVFRAHVIYIRLFHILPFFVKNRHRSKRRSWSWCDRVKRWSELLQIFIVRSRYDWTKASGN